MQRLLLALALQQSFVERGHQHTCCFVVHVPQTHHQCLHTGFLQSALQTCHAIRLYITHTRLAGGQYCQFGGMQVGQHDLPRREHAISMLLCRRTRPTCLCAAQQQTRAAHRVIRHLAVCAYTDESRTTRTGSHLLRTLTLDIKAVRSYMQLRRRLTRQGVERLLCAFAACYGLRARVHGGNVLHLLERCRQVLELLTFRIVWPV